METTNIIFGQRLAELRQEKGITQQEMSDLLGFGRGQIAHYEQARRQPDLNTVRKLADFFNVSLDYLLGRTDKRRNLSGEIAIDDLNIPEELKAQLRPYIKSIAPIAKGADALNGLTEEQVELLIRLAKEVKKNN